MDKKEIKRKIRLLRKFKKDTKIGTDARRQINKQIRGLKTDFEKVYNCNDPKKKVIIGKINTIERHINDLREFTVEQLELYYIRIKEKYDNSLEGKMVKIFGEKKWKKISTRFILNGKRGE